MSAPQKTMLPAKVAKANQYAANASIGQQNQHLIRTGAVHGKAHPDLSGVNLELAGVVDHGQPGKRQSKSLGDLSTTPITVNTSKQIFAQGHNTARGLSAQQDQRPRPTGLLNKYSMQHWYAEAPGNQPWNALNLGPELFAQLYQEG